MGEGDAQQDVINAPIDSDKVSNILKWVLLITAIVCFAVVAWGTYKTYQLAPPLPQQFITTSGQVIMTDDDIVYCARSQTEVFLN